MFHNNLNSLSKDAKNRYLYDQNRTTLVDGFGEIMGGENYPIILKSTSLKCDTLILTVGTSFITRWLVQNCDILLCSQIKEF